MIAYDGPARLALGIIAGCIALVALALLVGRMMDDGDVDPVFEDIEPETDAPSADVVSLAAHASLRPRPVPVVDEITDAVVRMFDGHQGDAS